MTSTHRIVRPLLAAGLAVALAGCGSDDDQSDASSPSTGIESAATPGTDGSDPTAGGSTPADPSGSTTEQGLSAVALAESETGGTAYAVDRESDGWEVELAVGDEQVDVRVDQAGTEVLDTRPDGRLDDDDRAELDAATVTLTGAIEAALAEVPGELEDADLDEDDGTVAWKVSIRESDGAEREVHLDAADGDVLRVEND